MLQPLDSAELKAAYSNRIAIKKPKFIFLKIQIMYH
jgi:hypothetical protein